MNKWLQAGSFMAFFNKPLQ